MNIKEITQRAYDLFNPGDMETFFSKIVHDDMI